MAQTKKLSVATVYGKIDVRKVLAATAPIKVMRVIGQAIGTGSGESNFGPWQCLKGRFRATNPDTGEVSEAAILFLPDVALTPILVGLASGPVSFALDLFVRAAENVKPGGSVYEYQWEPLLPPSDDDPLKRLESQLLALEAPKADGAKADGAKADGAKAKGR